MTVTERATPTRSIDLFSGPGGWDVGAVALGFVPIGIEFDDAACATRLAAGLPTVQADIAEIDPSEYAPCDLLIASPPCQAFSAAGKGGGHQDAPMIYQVMRDLVDGRDTRDEYRPKMVDDRSLLVVEPLRWALELRPRWVALEQVPPVLPFWEWIADALRSVGYHCWTGVLRSEQYGVPQTRSRAFLIASSDGPVSPPSPTHQRYVPMPKETAHDTLFDPGPRSRIVHPGEDSLLPWVSMADALGWGRDDRAGFPRINDTDDGEEYRERDFRDADEPAGAVTEKIRSWRHEIGEAPAPTLCGHHTPRWAYQQGSRKNATVREGDEPAPTVLFGHNKNEVMFVKRERSGDRADEGFDPNESPSQALTSKARSWTVKTGDNSTVARNPPETTPYERDVEEPAPTVTGTADRWRIEDGGEPPEWTGERPAPTLLSTHRSDIGGLVGHQLPAGDGRNVGGRGWSKDRPTTTVTTDERQFGPHSGSAGESHSVNAVRITVEEASVLQGFPATHPWSGSRTAMFRQIGNAVPPPLARAVLEAALSAGGD